MWRFFSYDLSTRIDSERLLTKSKENRFFSSVTLALLYFLSYHKVVLNPVWLLKSNLALRLFTWRLRQASKRS
jgi:hypothetical protein